MNNFEVIVVNAFDKTGKDYFKVNLVCGSIISKPIYLNSHPIYKKIKDEIEQKRYRIINNGILLTKFIISGEIIFKTGKLIVKIK